MMSVLIAIALKSLLVAGLTLGLLALMKHRSAAERSWVAHIGLLALIIMAFAPLALPSWTVEAPALLGQAPAIEAPAPATKLAAIDAGKPVVAPAESTAPAVPAISTAAAASAIYAVPAAILLFITFLALARLIALRARAEVLVDGHWLTALARAQRRMGFKHGTALLTSNALASPISWGLMRPVILLNTRAVEASGEAEAIIAHELAHVARMDWVKLLLARIATALFWFNPLVWLLAREAHQLREEAADDAVLAADIPDTDYAQLLVGVARHECPGLLLWAHGVAPSKSSLARRVARVLDGKSVRGPVARSFAVGVFVGAVMVAAPLAALTLTPGGSSTEPTGKASTVSASEPSSAYYPGTKDAPADLGHIIADGVSTSVATATAAIAPVVGPKVEPDFAAVAPSGATVRRKHGVTYATAPSGASVVVYPADSHGRSKVVATSSSGATAVTYVQADKIPGLMASYGASPHARTSIDTAIELKAAGVTPEYVAEMRALGRRFAALDAEDFAGMRAVGVTPEFARDLMAAGFPGIDADELVEARAVGLTGGYVRAMRSAGVRGDLDDFVQLRAVGVDPAFAARARRAGMRSLTADDLVELQAVGISSPPRPPAPPRPPNVNPPNVNVKPDPDPNP
jgi:beta-lactamase regulating signal transducer with metallopeptidase domain